MVTVVIIMNMFSNGWSDFVSLLRRRPRVLVRDIAQLVERQKKLTDKKKTHAASSTTTTTTRQRRRRRRRTQSGTAAGGGDTRKRPRLTPAAQEAKRRKERHVRWHPDTQYVLTRQGIPLDESPELVYTRGELRERHMYHFTHTSPEAERNMKRPKHVGVFRVRAFEHPANNVPHYVRPQDKHLRQMYGYDKQHPLPPGEETRTNRDLTWTMVTDKKTGVRTPYHIDLFAIRGQRTLQNSKKRRLRKQKQKGWTHN